MHQSRTGENTYFFDIFFFKKTVEVKVIYTGGQEELTHTLKEQMSLNMEVKCKLLHTADRAYNRLTSARCFRTISKYNNPINTWLLAAWMLSLIYFCPPISFLEHLFPFLVWIITTKFQESKQEPFPPESFPDLWKLV